MDSCSSSSEEEFFYPLKGPSKSTYSDSAPFVPLILPSPAPKKPAASVFSPLKELISSVRTSRLSALKEGLEATGQAFVDARLVPLAHQRQALERLERLLELQAKWVGHARDNNHVSLAECQDWYETDLEELLKVMRSAHEDYLAQRVVETKEETQQRMIEFDERLVGEQQTWPLLRLGGARSELDSLFAKIEGQLHECIEQQLRVDAEQVQGWSLFSLILNLIFDAQRLFDLRHSRLSQSGSFN